MVMLLDKLWNGLMAHAAGFFQQLAQASTVSNCMHMDMLSLVMD